MIKATAPAATRAKTTTRFILRLEELLPPVPGHTMLGSGMHTDSSATNRRQRLPLRARREGKKGGPRPTTLRRRRDRRAEAGRRGKANAAVGPVKKREYVGHEGHAENGSGKGQALRAATATALVPEQVYTPRRRVHVHNRKLVALVCKHIVGLETGATFDVSWVSWLPENPAPSAHGSHVGALEAARHLLQKVQR